MKSLHAVPFPALLLLPGPAVCAGALRSEVGGGDGDSNGRDVSKRVRCYGLYAVVVHTGRSAKYESEPNPHCPSNP